MHSSMIASCASPWKRGGGGERREGGVLFLTKSSCQVLQTWEAFMATHEWAMPIREGEGGGTFMYCSSPIQRTSCRTHA